MAIRVSSVARNVDLSVIGSNSSRNCLPLSLGGDMGVKSRDNGELRLGLGVGRYSDICERSGGDLQA